MWGLVCIGTRLAQHHSAFGYMSTVSRKLVAAAGFAITVLLVGLASIPTLRNRAIRFVRGQPTPQPP